MNILPEALQNSDRIAGKLELHLPFGLIGLRHLTHFELEPAEEGMVFQILRATGTPGNGGASEGEGAALEFVVAEPAALVESYQVALRDEDVESLRISQPSDALFLNIVSVHSLDPQHITVNLVGPIVVNRSTLIGQQVIIENSTEFSVEHVLVDQRAASGLSGTVASGT